MRNGDLITTKAWALPALALGLCAWMGSARAENDFEFAKGLLAQDSRTFPTEELVELFATKVEKHAQKDTALEAKLIVAMLRRKQAESASAEKRNDLLTEADNLYKAFMAANPKHRLAGVCQEEQATIQLDYAKALVKAAEENPATAAENRKKAVEILKVIADARQKESEALRPGLSKALKDIEKWWEDHPEAEAAPANVIAPAQAALNKYIPADRMYVVARMEEVNAHAEGGGRKAAADELIAYCQKQIDAEDLSMLDDVIMWYYFIQGRLHSLVLVEDKAADAWKKALDINVENFPPEVKKNVTQIRNLIIRDLVKMKLTAGAKGDKNKYADIINIIDNAKYDTSFKAFFNEDPGKDLLLDYAEALVRQPEAGTGDFEKAIKTLRDIAEKDPRWSYNVSRKMAEVMREARVQGVKPRLTARQWYETAHGFYIDGSREYKKYQEQKDAGETEKADESLVKAVEQYENAVDYYRRSIGQARKTDATDTLTRLEVEPKAWLEMGLAYHKMEHYHEAVIAYQALRTNFMPKYRKRWMPDEKKEAKFYANKDVKKALDELDRKKDNQPDDGVLNKVQKNILIALNLNIKHANTSYNKAIKAALLSDEEVGIEVESSDPNYQKGKLAMEEARGLKDEGTNFFKKKEFDQSEKQFVEALKKFEEGAGYFGKTAPSAGKAYEVALYQAGTCYTFAQGLLSDPRKLLKDMPAEEIKTKIGEYTDKALEYFKKYEDYVAKEDDPSEEGKARRAKLARGVLLNRPTLLYGADRYKETIEACDAFLEWEKKNLEEGAESKAVSINFNKFRAYSQLAGSVEAPESDPYLAEMEKILPMLKEKEKLYAFALGNLSNRYNNASSQSKNAQQKAGKTPEEAEQASQKYESKIAIYQAQALAMKPEEDRTLEEYGRVLYYHEKTGEKKKAADIAYKMLKRFDPENRNMKMGYFEEGKGLDQEEIKFWQDLAAKMNAIYRYSNDLQKWKRAKADHIKLVDYMFDTAVGNANRETPRLLPEEDKVAVDYEKALEHIASIKANYPDCHTHKPADESHLIEGKSYIQMIEDEIDYRRQIIATRDLLSELALEVAGKMVADGNEAAAKKYRAIADEQIGILLEIYGNVPSMKLKSANIKVANGDYEGALDTLYEVKRDEPSNTSDLYIKTSKRIAEVYLERAKKAAAEGDTAAAKSYYTKAVEYPQFMATTAGIDSPWVGKWWPDMKDFIEVCYTGGAPRPEKVAIEVPKGLDYKPKSNDEKEFEVLHLTYQQGLENANMKKQLHTPDFLRKYNLLKGKIENFKEYLALDTMATTVKGTDKEKEVLTDKFVARYEIVKEVERAESEAWQALIEYDQAIMDKGGVANVPDEVKTKRTRAFEKVDKLRAKLKEVPKVDLPKEAE